MCLGGCAGQMCLVRPLGCGLCSAYAAVVGVVAHVLVVACSAPRAYAGVLWADVIKRCTYSGMHICMGKVPLWGKESSVQGSGGV